MKFGDLTKKASEGKSSMKKLLNAVSSDGKELTKRHYMINRLVEEKTAEQKVTEARKKEYQEGRALADKLLTN